MPTYQYACTECGQQLEAVQSFSDPALTECPACQGRLRKVFNSVGIVFKGSGFYRTDSRDGAGKDGPNGASAKADKASNDKADKASKSDSANGGSGATKDGGSGTNGSGANGSATTTTSTKTPASGSTSPAS